MTIHFENRVAIVTGAGNGLGRSHALALAARGAKLVVNDPGGARDGRGQDTAAADNVVNEIKASGGEAIANYGSVSDPQAVEQMRDQAIEKWGRVDILINNAGILRDKSFAKMTHQDIKDVFDVHVMGAFNCCKAVWEVMRQQNFGRIVMTSSSSGLYGNFGQANYGAAKMALVGLMNTLCLEGAKYNIFTNTIAPIAATRMTEDLLPENLQEMLTASAVTAGVMALCHEDSPNRFILCAGAGGYSRAQVFESEGTYFPEQEQTPGFILKSLDNIASFDNKNLFTQGSQQTEHFLKMAMSHVSAS